MKLFNHYFLCELCLNFLFSDTKVLKVNKVTEQNVHKLSLSGRFRIASYF